MALTVDREVFGEVAGELAAARAKFPAFHSAHEGIGVILEEWEELKAEAFKGGDAPRDHEAMRREAIQVAAMAIRFVEDVCDGVR
jgi:hypothetical protein